MLESIKGGVRLHLFIQPKASKNEIIGEHNGELKIKLSAPPVDGKANAGLIEFLSDVLSIPKRDIHLTKGESNRHKTVEIQNIEIDSAKTRLGIK